MQQHSPDSHGNGIPHADAPTVNELLAQLKIQRVKNGGYLPGEAPAGGEG